MKGSSPCSVKSIVLYAFLLLSGSVGLELWSQPAYLSPEFQVHSYTSYSQSHPVVSVDARGNFVVAWHGFGPEGDFGIYARRFAASGEPKDNEFRVNVERDGFQRYPDISHGPEGDFTIVWQSNGDEGDGSSEGVRLQRFDANGSRVGDDMIVNTETFLSQSQPRLSHDSSGNSVVVWQSLEQDGDHFGIYGQRFDAAGDAVAAEFQINVFTPFHQTYPSVSHAENGGFVVVWTSRGMDGPYPASQYSVEARRYAPSGEPIGNEFRISAENTETNASYPVVDHSPDGFVVVWATGGTTGYVQRVKARFVDPSGQKVGEELEFLEGQDSYVEPHVAWLGDGTFLSIWTRSPDPSSSEEGREIVGQRLSASGQPLGGPFRVNTEMAALLSKPAVGGGSDGSFVTVWATDQFDEFSSVVGRTAIAQLFADGFESGDSEAWNQREN